MSLTTAGTGLRWVLMAVLASLAAWSIPAGEHLTVAGLVLTAVVICGFFVKRGRSIWFAVGACAVLWAMWLSVIPSDTGPTWGAAGGYGCGTAFTPTDVGEPISEDAPPGMTRQCRAVEDERRPFILVLLGIGTYALVQARRAAAGDQMVADAVRDPVKA